MEGEKRWYVVHTYSGFENKAKKSLEEKVRMEGLTEQFGEILIPMEQVVEMVKGEIFANVWSTDRIARISPKTGAVTGWIDLRGLLSPADATGVDVLNGIAYDAAKDRLFVTGKLWPKLFEIRLVKQPGR